jgi:hypothetical protein
MTPSNRDPDSERGFATAAAMALSLALALGASALVIRAAQDLRVAEAALERTRAAYALDGIQTLAAEAVIDDPGGPSLRRIAFADKAATVRVQAWDGKRRPIGACGDAAGDGDKAPAMTGQTAPPALPRTVRLIAAGDDGWTEDRIVRLTGDPANPVLVLDRRLLRRADLPPRCPPPPDAGVPT